MDQRRGQAGAAATKRVTDRNRAAAKPVTRSTSTAASIRYQPPRLLGEIEADIKTIKQDILKLLREVAG